jgi:Amt family ammonium transporter
LIAGVLSNFVFNWRASRTKLDDSLDVFACHGVSGVWGALATGLFATTAVNASGSNGLFYGNPRQLVIQIIAVAVSAGYAFMGSFILLKLINFFLPLRVSSVEEEQGLDATQHGEEAYS